MKKRPLYLAISALLVQPVYAESVNQLDSISITATKIERESKTVPQSVYVVDEKQIESENATSVNELISKIPGVTAVSKNNGYDSRLIIRGAGLKAPYGVREIMVIRDGVPMTDPDSFTRFDVIDIDDIESVEVYKGPGSIFASNASGGVVFIQSKSVFDDQQDRVKVGYGSFGTAKLNVKKSIQASDTDSFAINFSRRQSENSWRDWNQFDTTQFSVKHGHFFDDDSVLETEIAYTQANLQLPQSLSAAEFDAYKDSGETTNTSSAWQKNGRYSNTLFVNSRYETTMGEFDFKPQVYMTRWDHFHPVTGMINDSQDNTVIGTDLAWSRSHDFFNMPSEQIFGIGLRADIQNDAKKYKYADVTLTSGKITQVNSDEKGDLASIEDSDSQIYSAYFQESFSPNAKWIIDLGLRTDLLNMHIQGQKLWEFNYSPFVQNYAAVTADKQNFKYQESYQLFSPKIGASYALTDTLNIFAMAVSANQAPTASEMQANQTYNKGDLKGATSSNIEFGLKQRGAKLSADINIYYTQVTDEIVSVKEGFTTYYENAGQTERKGIELSAQYEISSALSAGANASATDYRYIKYVSAEDGDISGNRPRFIPDYEYALFANWQKQAYSARLEAIGFGPYYIDNANTERDSGYDGVFNLMLGYSKKAHLVNLSIRNLLDKRYSQETSLSRGTYYYTPGTPRSLMLTYQYKY